jgi:tetratricopeptide (TPR) repeat protein
MPRPVPVLQIRHLPDAAAVHFQVVRLPDGKAGPVVGGVPDPVGFPVEGWPDKGLLPGLRWYLEQFLDYPFDPETTHAELVLKALRRWGEMAFDALFGGRDAGGWFDAATRGDYADLHLQIVSDDPAVLAWPWEALYDREAGSRLAHACQLERRLDGLHDPPRLKKLPKDRVNILLVIARPYERDLRYHSIARPLVEWAAQPDVPAAVHVLRPPTFDRLREHLRERRGFYHILHFDGHGAYGDGPPPAPGTHKFQSTVQGRLVFENADGGPDPIKAELLSELLREGAVPAVVLNACQSAMVDNRADDAFASAAAALLRAGVRSVTAMAYSLLVGGAQQFLPAFYRRLFEKGSLADAVRAGRQQMRSKPERPCVGGLVPLEDWLVPVLYQQEAPDFKFVKKARPKEQPATRLPEEAQDKQNPYGLVGRDGAILELERAMRRKPAGVLVSGLGGVGKTTLVKGFLHWLEQTGGLGAGVFWFHFGDVRSAEYVFNRLGEVLFGVNFIAQPLGQKLTALEQAFRQRPFLIVWDNFESAKGIPGTAVVANLAETDGDQLRDFLGRLRGGATKVLLTSRSPEDWLGATNIGRPIGLGGLDGEERGALANAILDDQGLKGKTADAAFADLMGLLNGHPLAMRVILPRLASQPAAELAKALRENFAALKPNMKDEAEARLFSTLRFATHALPLRWRPLLFLLAQHEGFADAGLLAKMAQGVDGRWTRATIDECLGALRDAGLLRQVVPSLWEMHPAVTGFLRAALSHDLDAASQETWRRSFVDVLGGLANTLAGRPLHEQRGIFSLHGANFHSARTAAQQLQREINCLALTQALAMYALNTHNHPTAERLFLELAEQCNRLGLEKEAASALHQLGRVAGERRDFDAAERWFHKALAIKERLGDTRGAALTYHELGMVAQERRDFDAAERWFHKALAITERLGDEPRAAITHHQLGNLAEERRDYDDAERWFHKALAVFERLAIAHHAASTYHHLGVVAQERRDFDAAERWFHKALAIKERLDDEDGAASTYHHLGVVAEKRRDFDAAERWHHKALAVTERLGDKHRAAQTYHQLGIIAQERRDFDAAERWHHKALATFEQLGDEHGAAGSCHQMGVVALLRRDFDAAEHWYYKALAVNERLGDEHRAAQTYLGLGAVAQERRDRDAAQGCFQKALNIFQKLGDEYRAAIATGAIDRLEQQRSASSPGNPPETESSP